MAELKPWTHSRLDCFVTCPRKFEAEYVTKTVPYTESEAQRFGNVVHKHFEDYQLEHKPLPEFLKIHQPFMDELDALGTLIGVEINGAISTKLVPIAVNKWFKPVEPLAAGERSWWHGKIDLLRETNMNGRRRAVIVDYKTGKMHSKLGQLHEYAMWAFVSGYDEAEVMYYWTQTKQALPRFVMPKQQLPQIMKKFVGPLKQYVEAHRTEIWQPRPNGLCRRWCGVTSCEHCGI